MAKKKEETTGNEWDLVVSGLGKKFGKGLSLFQMNNESVRILGVESISTQLLSLDNALGIFGFPRGRIVEVYGPESGGKCLTKDSYILISNGWRTIEEIFLENGIAPSCSKKVTEKETWLVNKDGLIEPTTNFTNNGRRPITKITTVSGTEVESTSNHPHMVISQAGNTIWRLTKNLREGDYLVCMRNCFHSGTTFIDDDKAYALGALIANGDFSKNRICIASNDSTVQNIIKSILPTMLGIKPSAYPKRNAIDYRFDSEEGINNFYSFWGFSPGSAKDRKLGKVVRNLTQKSLAGVLRGYIDCRCFIDAEKKEIEIISTSKTLLQEVKLALLQFGILSTLNTKTVKAYPDNNYYRLTITGSDAQTYVDVIRFRSETRKNIWSSVPARTQCQASLDSTSSELNKNDYFLDCIKKIESLGEKPTFDFVMEKTHSFIANGIITHNTSLALQAVASTQKLFPEKPILYVDLEHSLDPAYMKNVGVSFSNLWVSQPDSGEEATQIVLTAVESGQPSLVIIDSIAAVIPQKEIEGEMTDQQMGKVGAIMGKFCRKIIAPLQKSKTLLLCTNQTRMKLGPMPGEERPGGKAIRFFASQILRVRKDKNIVQGNEIVGVWIEVVIRKNKVAPPFKVASIPLLFEGGFSPEMTLLDTASAEGIIEKSGAWYSYDGERLGQGVFNAAKNITPEQFNIIYNEFKDSKMKGTIVLEEEIPDAHV